MSHALETGKMPTRRGTWNSSLVFLVLMAVTIAWFHSALTKESNASAQRLMSLPDGAKYAEVVASDQRSERIAGMEVWVLSAGGIAFAIFVGVSERRKAAH